MTKKDALTAAIDALTAPEFAEVVETLTTMREQVTKPHPVSDKVKAARKEKNVAARIALVEQVIPVLRETLSHSSQGLTAKEIFSDAQMNLPADFSVAKVQNILRREMAPMLEKIEAKNKPNVYKLK